MFTYVVSGGSCGFKLRLEKIENDIKAAPMMPQLVYKHSHGLKGELFGQRSKHATAA